MDVQSWMAVFVGIVAFSFLLQSLAIFGIYTRVRQLTGRIEDISTDVKQKLSDVTDTVQHSVDAARPIMGSLQQLNATLISVSDLVRHRASDLDRLAQETTDTLRSQLVRVDDVVESATARVHHIVDTWHQGIIEPTRELTALIKAFKTGFAYFFSRRDHRHRTTASDDELFI